MMKRQRETRRAAWSWLLAMAWMAGVGCGPPPEVEGPRGGEDEEQATMDSAADGTEMETDTETDADAAAQAGDDPFLWLEEVQGEAALAWAKARNEETFAVLKEDPRYEPMRVAAEAILDASDRIPYGGVRGGYVYNFWRDDTHVRGVWRRMALADYLEGAPNEGWEALLDVDALAEAEEENWVYKGVECLAPDFERCLIELSRGGKDASVVREFDVGRRAFVEDGFVTSEAKTSVSWLDADTVIIGTDFGEGSMTTSGYARTQRVWRRGEALSEAREVFAVAEDDVWSWGWVSHSPAGRAVLLLRGETFYTGRLHLLGDDLETTLELPLPEDISPNGVLGDRWLIATLRSPWEVGGERFEQGSLVAIDLAPLRAALAGGPAATLEVEAVHVPDARSSVRGVHVGPGEVLVETLTDVKSRVLRVRRGDDGAWTASALALPAEAGVASLVAVSEYSPHAFLIYEDMLSPEALYHVDLAAEGTGLEQVRALPARFDAAGMRVEQRQATSADGTQVPYFVMLPAGYEEGTPRPTYLYAYGGFESPVLPQYRALTGKLWVAAGGVFAVANIRGGGEYGPRWHQAALKANRQRAFDDFHAVAEALIETGVTTREQLGIHGGSNGGLLMGVAFTQRPELYEAVICEVPLLDMLRYHTLLAGASWMAEYGDPEVAEERAYIEAYSPYQNVRAGVDYPRVFFTTSTADDRVHPGHARKMAARMIEQGHEVFYFENIEGGHGGVTNNKQRAMTTALKMVYLMRELGLEGGGVP